MELAQDLRSGILSLSSTGLMMLMMANSIPSMVRWAFSLQRDSRRERCSIPAVRQIVGIDLQVFVPGLGVVVSWYQTQGILVCNLIM